MDIENLPLSEIAKYSGGPPKDSFPFTGLPRQRPSDKNKLVLIYDPLGNNPIILEFKLEDVLFIEEVHSAVTEAGEGVPLVKIWVRRGAHGVIMEPFEVDDSVNVAAKTRELKKRFLDTRKAGRD
jgi:hypothetical protein